MKFVGPSYDLKVKRSDTQRSINLMPTAIESGDGKTPMFLKSAPGLREFSGPVEPPPEPVVSYFYLQQAENIHKVAADTLTIVASVTPWEGHVPADMAIVDGVLYTGFELDNDMAAIDPATMTLDALLPLDMSAMKYARDLTVAADGERIYVTSAGQSYGTDYMAPFVVADQDVSAVWTIPTSARPSSSAVLTESGDLLIVSGGKLLQLDPDTGTVLEETVHEYVIQAYMVHNEATGKTFAETWGESLIAVMDHTTQSDLGTIAIAGAGNATAMHSSGTNVFVAAITVAVTEVTVYRINAETETVVDTYVFEDTSNIGVILTTDEPDVFYVVTEGLASSFVATLRKIRISDGVELDSLELGSDGGHWGIFA